MKSFLKKMINIDVTGENVEEPNQDWLQIPNTHIEYYSLMTLDQEKRIHQI